MPDKSLEAAMQEIRKLCRELAEKQNLAPETRDELCGHMEDKLAGYLRGEVPVSVEDALVLVRAHFGDAEKISRDLARQTPLATESFFSFTFNHQRMYLTLLVIIGLSTTLTIPLGLVVYFSRQFGVNPGPIHFPTWVLQLHVITCAAYLAFILVTLTARRINPEVGRRLTRALNFALILAPPFGTALGLYGLLKVDQPLQRQTV